MNEQEHMQGCGAAEAVGVGRRKVYRSMLRLTVGPRPVMNSKGNNCELDTMMHGKTDPRERMSEHSTKKEKVSEKVTLSK
jgi:hypothetical protein